jgi:hypothetical protein
VGLAYPVLGPMLALGVTGKYLGMGGNIRSNAITMDAGLLFRPVAALAFAVTFQNFIDVRSPEAPRMLAFGINYGGDGPAHAEADWRIDFATNPEGPRFSYHLGLEYLIANLVWIRTGFIRDEAVPVFDENGKSDASQFATGGFGVLISGFGVDIAYRNQIGGVAAKTFAVAFKLQL